MLTSKPQTNIERMILAKFFSRITTTSYLRKVNPLWSLFIAAKAEVLNGIKSLNKSLFSKIKYFDVVKEMKIEAANQYSIGYINKNVLQFSDSEKYKNTDLKKYANGLDFAWKAILGCIIEADNALRVNEAKDAIIDVTSARWLGHYMNNICIDASNRCTRISDILRTKGYMTEARKFQISAALFLEIASSATYACEAAILIETPGIINLSLLDIEPFKEAMKLLMDAEKIRKILENE